MNRIFIYDKQKSVFTAGIAILLMFIHHFWGHPEWITDQNSGLYLDIFCFNKDISIERYLGYFGKICVAIFAFNSGYAMWIKRNDYTIINNLNRIFKFLLSYWVICSFFLLYGVNYDDVLPNTRELLLNLIGISTGVNGLINVPFAWYVSYYISLIFISPLLIYIVKQRTPFVFVYLLLLFVFFFLEKDNIFAAQLLYWGKISIIGMLFARYDLFNVLMKIFSDNLYYNTLLLIIVFASRALDHYLSYILVPFFLFSVINIFRRINNHFIENCCTTLGKHSMNMWYLHGIFFTGTMKIQHFLYLPHYSLLVLLWAFILIFPLSVFFSKVQTYLLYLLKRS